MHKLFSYKSVAILFFLCFCTSLPFSPRVSAAQQGEIKCPVDRPIRLGGLDWDSNRFHVALAGFILEHGYGCKTETIPGSTIPLLTGLVKGSLDVVMEIWNDNVTEAWERGYRTGKVKFIGTTFPDAVQGWFVPRYLVEGENAPAKDLKHVRDLGKYKNLFKDPEAPQKGRFYNCIYGWNCEKINSKKLKVYGLGESFTNFRPGTGAALSAAIASAYKRKKPILYYYWGPSWVVGQFDGVMLAEPPYEEKTWKALGKDKNPAKATAYPLVQVRSAANTKFLKQVPEIEAFLKKFKTSNKLVSEMLVYIKQKRSRKAKDAALHFLRTYPNIWQQWIPSAQAEHIKAKL